MATGSRDSENLLYKNYDFSEPILMYQKEAELKGGSDKTCGIGYKRRLSDTVIKKLVFAQKWKY